MEGVEARTFPGIHGTSNRSRLVWVMRNGFRGHHIYSVHKELAQ